MQRSLSSPDPTVPSSHKEFRPEPSPSSPPPDQMSPRDQGEEPGARPSLCPAAVPPFYITSTQPPDYLLVTPPSSALWPSPGSPLSNLVLAVKACVLSRGSWRLPRSFPVICGPLTSFLQWPERDPSSLSGSPSAPLPSLQAHPPGSCLRVVRRLWPLVHLLQR